LNLGEQLTNLESKCYGGVMFNVRH
jgi:hypothetical protein